LLLLTGAHAVESTLGAIVSPGSHDDSTNCVQGICGGVGLRVEMSEASHEICQALWTRRPCGKGSCPLMLEEEGAGVVVGLVGMLA
jgi:hypothetical protein